MRQERKQVTIDLKLPSNEILHFTGDAVLMTERDRIRGLVATIGKMKKSPFVGRSERRYDLSNFMANQNSLYNTPAPQQTGSRLDAESLN